jgi:serine/threonine-protein kinase
VLSALLIVALGAMLLRRTAPAPGASPEVAAFAIDLSGLWPVRGGNTGGFVAISADGRRMVITARNDSDPRAQQRLFQRTLDRPEFVAVPGTELSSNPFISPDGEWAGFDSHSQLKKVSFSGGVPIPICDLPSPLVGAVWLDDGTIVFSTDGQLFRVPAAGGKPEAVAKQATPEHRYAWPAVIPGRHAVLVAVRSVSGARARFRVAAVDVTTGEEHPLADAGSAPKFVNGFVVYAQQAIDDSSNPFPGRLLAVPFDTSRLSVTGPPVTVLDDALVFNGGAGNYDVAENGTLVFFSGALSRMTREVAWLSPSGGMLESLKGTPDNVTLVRLSRDGRTALMQSGFGGVGTVSTYSLDRGSITRVSFDGDATNPIFGPDAGMVTFSSLSQRGLFSATVDGGKAPERLTTAVAQHVPGSWSGDGATLIFTQLSAGVGDVLTLTRGARDPKPFVATPADERTPTLSPNDRWVAYGSNESGRFEVYVRPFVGSGGRYTVSSGGGEAPLWSKDGRHLFYVRESTNLMVVDVLDDTTFRATPPRTVVTSTDLSPRTLGFRGIATPPFDVAEDGRLLLVRVTNTAGENASARVILNLGEEIRRRMPAAKP